MSFTFKGISSKTHFKVLEVSHAILPPSKVRFMELGGISGAKFIDKSDGVREIEVAISVISTSPIELMKKLRELGGWLDDAKPQKLTFHNEPDKFYWAIISDATDIEQILNIGMGSIKFLCLDPYAYETSSKTISVPSGVTTTLTLTSTASTYPLIKAVPSTNSSTFKIIRGDEVDVDYDPFVEIKHSIALNDEILIDCEKGLVTINGVPQMQAVTLSSDFFHLSKGKNFLSCSSGYAVEITYTERWK